MNTKRILSIILTVLLVASALPTVGLNVRASTETIINTTGFAGGSGTIDDPYLIETKVHLNNVRNHLDAHYKLIADIVFMDADFQEDGDFYNNGAGWLPIGSDESATFTGTFDGNDYSISNICMIYSVNSIRNIGFFGITKGSIKNLDLSGSINVTITNTATYYIGGLVGYASGEVINCTSECKIKVSSSFTSAIVNQSTLYLGGIAGYSKQRIENCKNNGTITVTEKSYDHVTARGYVGGICGYAEQSVIRCDNFNSILVQATAGTGYDVGIAYDTGGICGVLDGVLNHCKNAGNIEIKDTRKSGNGYSFYAGGIVGVSKAQAKILDSSNRGSVRSGAAVSCSGGIVAENRGSVSRCSNLGEIYAATQSKGDYSSESYSGGICGYSSGNVTESYNAGTILWDQLFASCYNYSGGIVGRLVSASIINCYNAGHIAENMFMGNGAGIAGYSNSSATISNCYNVGAAGMSSGIMGGSAKTTNCYYLEYANSSTDKGDTAAKVCTEAEMMQQDTFVGFDFDEIWTYDSSANYFFPILKNNLYNDEDFVDNTSEFAGGDGSFAHPYLIANSTHLNNVKNHPRSFFKLSSDIDMKNISWTQKEFYGVLDGAGHSIKNLTNSLFLNNEGCIVNLHLEDANIDDSGFVGQFHFGKILNCSFSGKAVSGGFVWDASGPIVNCVNYGTINGGGGIAGAVAGTSGDAGSWKGVLIGCVNFGTIYGNYNAGGLAGSSNGSDIINCYNAGNVYGGSSAGGIIGSITQADVINCYNVGVVSTGSNGTAGALIGKHSSGYAENCYYLDNMSSAGPDETITGTILDRNDISKRSSFVGFDFNSVWTMEGSENYSYPELLRTPIVVDEFAPSYTVIFKDCNGDILSNTTYRYGDTINAPADPTKVADNTYTYTFAGWDKEVVDCVGNATYTATYTSNYIDYTVIFKNWDGTVLSTKTYHYGDKVTAPANPTRDADNIYTYAFAGWNKAVVDCTGNITYTAIYTPVYIEYSVVFKNWNGDVLSTKTYHYGDKIEVPNVPIKESDNNYTYTFAGWDKEVVDCVGNATYTATYTNNYIDYTVVFKDWDGTVLSTKTYHYGDKVTAPTNPTRDADNTYTYTFSGWDKEVTDCSGNVTYTATYINNYISYTVVFKNWDGTVLSTDTYHYGDKVTAPANPAKEADNTYTYTFNGWDKEVVDCVGDATYTATYTNNYIDYTVVFKDWDGTVLSSETYHYGDEVTVPAVNGRPADNGRDYVFAGWDQTVTNCTRDVIYTAIYKYAYILGDLDGDGDVNTTDLATMKLFLAGLSELSDTGLVAGDFNKDGAVNTTDLASLKLLLAGINN